VESVVEQARQAGRINGSVLIVQGEEVVLEKSYGLANAEWGVPNTAATRFPIASITKSFTALLVLQSVERGELALETPLRELVPAGQAGAFGAVTLHHLLSQSSGFPEFEVDSFEPFDGEVFWTTLAEQVPAFAPGERFDYRNENFTCLALILERISGRTYAELLEERITRVLDLKDTGVFDGNTVVEHLADGYRLNEGTYELPALNHLGNAVGSGFVYSTPRDLLAFARGVQTGRLLGPELTRRMKSAQAGSYGYGWLVRPMGPAGTLLFHPGRVPGYSSALAFTDSGAVVVVLNNITNPSSTILGLTQALVTETLKNAPPAH